MKVLMCPPLHHAPGAGEDAAAVMDEWRGLYRLLRDELDVQVDLLEPRPGLPKLVLAASAGFVWGDSFVASRPGDPSRGPESEAAANFFLVRGYRVPALPEGCRFDGQRDLAVVGGTVFAGHRSDEDLDAHRALSGVLGREVRSLRLSDRWDHPLDSCLCPLGQDGALFHPDALEPAARKLLEEHAPRLRAVDPADARRFGCNALLAGRRAVLPEGCGATVRELEKEGFQAHVLPLAAYARQGAGPGALALKVAD